MAFDWKQVDWADRNARIGVYFTVHEALWLPGWRVYHVPSGAEKQEIVKTAAAMDQIRGLFNAAVHVHCWMRPRKVTAPSSPRDGQDYNAFAGSKSVNSPHVFGRAADFHIAWMEGAAGCAHARQIILPHLEAWNIRMEDMNGGWIHIDTNPVVRKRFFKP